MLFEGVFNGKASEKIRRYTKDFQFENIFTAIVTFFLFLMNAHYQTVPSGNLSV